MLPSLPLIGTLLWMTILFASIMLSGNEYYRISNWWIVAVPLGCFLIAYAALISLKKRSSIKMLSRVGLPERTSSFILASTYAAYTLLLLTTTSAFLVLQAAGISILEAQALRDKFYTVDFMATIGGAYFVWFQWALLGCAYALFTIGSCHDVVRRRPFSTLTTTSLLIITVLGIMTGGRGAILNAIVIYSGSWLSIASSRKLRNKKTFKYTLFALFVLLPGFLFQSINRLESNAPSNIGATTAVKYFVGPVFALDQLIVTDTTTDIASALDRPGIAAYGIDTLLVSGLLRGVLGVDIDSALAKTSAYFHQGVEIGHDIVTNAHYTAGAKAYIEMGITGYILMYAVLAILAVKAELSKVARNTLWTTALYALVFFSITFSSRLTVVDSPEFFIAIIACFFLRGISGNR